MNHDFVNYLNRFFTNYLCTQTNYSICTIKSYKDSFRLYFHYLKEVKGVKVGNISFENFCKENILSFLQYIEEERNCCISTRNTRLASFKSFCQYLVGEDPIYINTAQKILSIKTKKKKEKIPIFLTEEEMELLFKQPNIKINSEVKDLLILSILYDSAIRVNELIHLKVKDCLSTDYKIIRVIGKGNKERQVPLSKNTAKLIKIYIEKNKLYYNDYIFVNKQNARYSAEGINYIINKYISRMKAINKDFNKKVTPHTFRHSRAIHLLEKGLDLISIRDLLGHQDITTTQIYARIINDTALQKIMKLTDENREVTEWNDPNNNILEELGLL